MNLDQFDTPPAAAIAEAFGARVRPMEFLEAIPEPTSPVSRVKAFRAKWGLQRFDLTREQDQDDWTGYPEWEAAKEAVEGLPEIMNEGGDPEMIEWALNVCLRPLLPYAWDTPKGTLTGRKYMRARINDIEKPEHREMVKRIVYGPGVRPYSWDTRTDQRELY